jgi:hypothetical protein
MIENTFSLFHNGIINTIPSEEITLLNFIDLLKQENKNVELVRLEADKKKRDKLKSKLSYVTFGGTFKKRSSKQLIKSSGLACLDIDDIENLNEIKEQIIKNECTHCLFISPSGKGLKLIVKIPEVESNEEYKSYWISIAKHYNLSSNDEASKDICRACYLSIDKFPYLNPDSKVYTERCDTFVTPSVKVILPKQKIRTDFFVNSQKSNSDDFLDKLKSSISMIRILEHFGVDTSKNPTNCPFHSCSQRCLSFNDEVCNCFDTDCGKGYNIFSFVKKIKGLNSSDTIKWLSEFAGLQNEYEESKQKYLNRNKKPMGWANSINIKRFAERNNLLNCPHCNTPFKFNETLGQFKCFSCGRYGGLNKFAEMIIQ